MVTNPRIASATAIVATHWTRAALGLASLSLGLALIGCGGNGNGTDSQRTGEAPAGAQTVAYVMTECRLEAGQFSARQELRIQQRGMPEVRVEEAAFTVDSAAPGEGDFARLLCSVFGIGRTGRASVIAGRFQRLGVSSDGTYVVFEVNDNLFEPALHFPRSGPGDLASGFYIVGADGEGLRRLAPPSRENSFRWGLPGSGDIASAIRITFAAPLSFNPDGRRITYTDCTPCTVDTGCEPCNDANEAVQIVSLDLFDPNARPVALTSLPLMVPPEVSGLRQRVTSNPVFLDNDTIVFTTMADALGRGVTGELHRFTLTIGASALTEVPIPFVPQLDGAPGTFDDQNFQITGDRPTATRLLFGDGISEVFYVDGARFLQLTNFRRGDTSSAFVSSDGERVFFLASPAIAPGSNPNGNCQIFSIAVTGGDLRQLTDFAIDGVSPDGCATPDLPPECGINSLFQDAITGALVFDSSCDPAAHTNPNGGQIFSVWPNGFGLHQLTSARGLNGDLGNDFSVELPGPFAASAIRR